MATVNEMIIPMEKAKVRYGAYLNKRLTDPITKKNKTLSGFFLYIPPNTILDEPIEISETEMRIFIGKGASVKWVSRPTSNSLLDIAIDDGGSFTHVTAPGAHTDRSDTIQVTLKRDAIFNHFSLDHPNKCDIHVRLDGEGSDATVKQIAHLRNKERVHLNICMEHVAPHCTSHQQVKSVLKDASKITFDGKIYVHREAQKTDSYQLGNHLVLGERAVGHTQPNLEIFADDVKASHGATLSYLNQEELFYLKSRGLSQEESEQLLIRGFIGELINEIPYPAMKEEYYGRI